MIRRNYGIQSVTLKPYKGYVGQVELDEESNIFFGKVIDLWDVITFQGTTIEEVTQTFLDSVDDYLAFCKELGEKPEIPLQQTAQGTGAIDGEAPDRYTAGYRDQVQLQQTAQGTGAIDGEAPDRYTAGYRDQVQWKRLNIGALVEEARHTGTYSGALIMTAVLVPIAAALISATAFVAQWPKGVAMPDWLALFIGTPLLLGSVSTLIAWFLLAFILRRFTAVDRINIGSYDLLLNRLSSLDSEFGILCSVQGKVSENAAMHDTNAASPLPLSTVTGTIAGKQVLESRDAIREMLIKKSLAWVTASGYTNLWKDMHSAEEALIEIQPSESVIANAIHDEMCILDSKIDNRDELLRKLRLAVTTLDPSSSIYLQQLPTSVQRANSTSPSVIATSDAASNEVREQGRPILREVRQALNEFRDSRWEAIVRVRNQLVFTMILIGFTTYVLLQFAILAGVPQSTIKTATTFYLVGAFIGLFSRLYNETQTSKSIDDYRLALARIVAAPILSGLAAVGGVLLTQELISLGNFFDPKNILSGMIVATVFGFTANLLIGVLQKQSEQYKTDLKSTAATRAEHTMVSQFQIVP